MPSTTAAKPGVEVASSEEVEVGVEEVEPGDRGACSGEAIDSDSWLE